MPCTVFCAKRCRPSAWPYAPTPRATCAGFIPRTLDTHEAPVLLLGSHIDTVPDAGRYDGVLGVALPLALLRALRGRRLSYAIELIAFSEEEGIRFRLPFLGSRALAATLGPAELARTDADGVSVAQAIRDFGLDPERLHDALLSPKTFAFLEVHLEQGPVLESLGLPLGIVETIVGQSRLELTFRGEANHAGTTPMYLRQDALAAAAASYLRCRERCARHTGSCCNGGNDPGQTGCAEYHPRRGPLLAGPTPSR